MKIPARTATIIRNACMPSSLYRPTGGRFPPSWPVPLSENRNGSAHAGATPLTALAVCSYMPDQRPGQPYGAGRIRTSAFPENHLGNSCRSDVVLEHPMSLAASYLFRRRSTTELLPRLPVFPGCQMRYTFRSLRLTHRASVSIACVQFVRFPSSALPWLQSALFTAWDRQDSNLQNLLSDSRLCRQQAT